MTLVEFLEARISEDEAAARTSVDDPVFGTAEKWEIEPDGPHYLWHTGLGIMVAKSVGDNCIAPAQAEHTVRWDPARVLAECASKRLMLELYDVERSNRDARRSPRTIDIEEERDTQERRTQEARCRVAEDMVQAFAQPYAGHPDWQAKWNWDLR